MALGFMPDKAKTSWSLSVMSCHTFSVQFNSPRCVTEAERSNNTESLCWTAELCNCRGMFKGTLVGCAKPWPSDSCLTRPRHLDLCQSCHVTHFASNTHGCVIEAEWSINTEKLVSTDSSSKGFNKWSFAKNLGNKSLVWALLQAISPRPQARGASFKKREQSCVLARSFLLPVYYLLTWLTGCRLN